MEQLESARKKVVELLGQVDEVDDGVVRAERSYNGKCYAVAYFDLADDIVTRARSLQDFQERILGDDFFGTPGDLRWNKYLYFVAGPNSRSSHGFDDAKAAIESDKEYARKRVVTEEELEALLGNVKHFTPGTADKDYNVVAEWEKRLSAVGLDELLDKPTRKDVVERIGSGTVARVPVAEKVVALVDADRPLARTWLERISIDKFRPVHDGQTYTFGQVTLIVGPNGTGKTSLLEAIEHFYCGYNRRPGTSGSPKISGTLVGGAAPIASPTDAARIRARCISWYNRNEQRTNRILDAFTRFNFLDTDAAFRLATDSSADALDIPGDLGRLLIGSDASGISDYLSKLAPEVTAALTGAEFRADDLTTKLTEAQLQLKEVQGRPSNSKALADAFRAALVALKWKAAPPAGPLPTQEESGSLQESIGHLEGVLSAGAGATTPAALSARIDVVRQAHEAAKPLELTRFESAKAFREHGDAALRDEQTAGVLDRWLTYLSAGYATTLSRYQAAKVNADKALGKLGRYAAAETPEVPEEYAGISLETALHEARLNLQNAEAQVVSLEKQAAAFGKQAAMRAEAARQLQKAAQASLDSGHPPDDCPICRAKYQPSELASLIASITVALEQPAELSLVSESLLNARKDVEYFQGWVKFFNFITSAAEFLGIPPNAECAELPRTIVKLKAGLTQADAELQAAEKDWTQLSNSGLSSNEHDLLLSKASVLVDTVDEIYDRSNVESLKQTLLLGVAASKQVQTQSLQRQREAESQLQLQLTAVLSDSWSTRANRDSGFAGFQILLQETTAVQTRLAALLRMVEIDAHQKFAEISNGLVSASILLAQTLEAAKAESTSSQTIIALNSSIESLTNQSNAAQSRVKNLRTAAKTLDALLLECSIEHATKESLLAIGFQINEIFSRIHAPNEYEYVGSDGTLLRTIATNQTRNLQQVSTGQRAAFALSVFLAMNRTAEAAPPVILIDDPIAHIDDLNALSFLDYLRDLAVNSNRQIFFATADTKIAALFIRKFGFLGEAFKQIPLSR